MKAPLVKICGITRTKDALYAAEAGADFLGFIFYEKSPRYIKAADAAGIIEHVTQHIPSMRFAGVFVNAGAEEIIEILETAGLTEVQLHGDETPGDVERLRALLNERGHEAVGIIKAFRVAGPEDVADSLLYGADYYLFDAFVEGERGGTGHVFNWKLLDNFEKMDKLFLSGGINSENVLEALDRVSPLGLDLSSSLEKEKGIKDKKMIDDFMTRLKIASK